MNKKNISLQLYRTMIFIFTFTVILAAQDFRQVYWGDSMEKVQLKERDGVYVDLKDKSPNSLAYTGISVADKQWMLIYVFDEGKLIAGSYSKDYSSSDYHDIRRLLIKKYGEPLSEDVWTQGLTIIMLLKTEESLMIAYIDKDKLNEFISNSPSNQDENLDGL